MEMRNEGELTERSFLKKGPHTSGASMGALSFTYRRGHRWEWVTSAAVWLVFGVFCVGWTARLSPAADAVELDRDSARRGSNRVWYDSEKDEIRFPASQLENNDVSDRHESIASQKSNSFWRRWFGDWSGNSNGNGTWGGLTDFFETLLQAWRLLLMLLLVLIFATTLYLLARMGVLPGFNKPRKSPPRGEDIELQKSKISDLPFEMEQPVGGLRAQAERLRAQGDYSKAMLYLFSYLLVELDSKHCIRLERGKTNGGYLRDLRVRPWLQNYMKRAAGAFEWVYFGRHSLDATTFDALWDQLTAFESQISLVPLEADSGRKGQLEGLTGARA
jgi:hypothetical protein